MASRTTVALHTEDCRRCLPSPWRRNKSATPGTSPLRVLILGPQGAGKTALLSRLAPGGAVRASTPTIGFGVEAAEVDNLSLSCWDMGGQGGEDSDGNMVLDPLARKCFETVDVFLVVVDASGGASALAQARLQLSKALASGVLRDRRVVVAANKQDIHGSRSGSEVSLAVLGADDVSGLQLRVVETSAETGQGLEELVSALASPTSRACSPVGPSAKAAAAFRKLRSRSRGAPCMAQEELTSFLEPHARAKAPRTIFGSLRVASVF